MPADLPLPSSADRTAPSKPIWVQDLGLTVLHDPPDGPARADLVFIHGLQGHPRRTWRFKGTVTKMVPAAGSKSSKTFGLLRRKTPINWDKIEIKKSVFWPAEILPEDHSDVRILTYGYDSHLSHWFTGPTNKMNITQHGRAFLHRLAQKRQGCQGRPLIFVVHSLGGLVVKETIIESRKQKHEPHLQDVYLSTRAIMFFGTPHRGAGDAGWVLC